RLAKRFDPGENRTSRSHTHLHHCPSHHPPNDATNVTPAVPADVRQDTAERRSSPRSHGRGHKLIHPRMEPSRQHADPTERSPTYPNNRRVSTPSRAVSKRRARVGVRSVQVPVEAAELVSP